MTRANTMGGTLLLAALALAACKAKEPPKPVEAPPPPPVVVPQPTATVEVGRAIGEDKRVMAALGEFKVRDTIYASVTTSDAPATAQLVATWTYQTGQTVSVDTQSVSGPSAITAFHISTKSPWPKGTYKVSVALDGAQMGEREFEVK